ncbi:hypothetical protein ABT352_16900 [Streptosporangium sp. NPDC000563]|uniref:hypothetical protein n=1 Tax=Streptosporangium sp. NPDC000563 TaxID=3154366 RepID=UPI003323F593
MYVRAFLRGFPQLGHEAGGTEQQKPGAGGGAVVATDEQLTETLKALKVTTTDDVASKTREET